MIAGPSNSSGDAYAELHLKGKKLKYTCVYIILNIQKKFFMYLFLFVSPLFTDGECKGENNIFIK